MDTWTELALDPPRAAGAPIGSAVIRSTPEDFQVDERLGFELDVVGHKPVELDDELGDRHMA